MDLALRDKKIFQMKAELENRKRLLCMKRKQLVQNKRENKLLENVLGDYETYNKRFINNHERKIVFLQQLHSYLERITHDLKLTDTKLQESKNEQRDIMKEITFLKNEIDNLVEDNEDINSNSNIDD
tara:strand:+ start:30 stop:410 length:381 start_codon:yes stop_codon:yes gene_type:complete